MAGAIVFQTSIIKNTFDLEKRPYLYVDVKPVIYPNNKREFYAGIYMTYRNEGLLTASNIKTTVKIASDASDKLQDTLKWHENTYGFYPYIKSVFPKQNIEPKKIVSNICNFEEALEQHVYVAIRITYDGVKGKEYYYDVDYVYKFEYKTSGDKKHLLLKYDTYCDTDEEPKRPKIEVDWSEYKTAKSTIKITENK